MSRTVEVIVGSPALDQPVSPLLITESKPTDPPGVTGFLKINPAALGWMEILTGAVAFGLVFWNYERWFLIPACFLVLIGVITTVAACTRNPCLVVTSQALNLLNIFSSLAVLAIFFFLFYVVISVRVFLAHSVGPKDFAFMGCNVLAVLFNIIVFSTSCCWCKSRKRLMVIHMNAAPPAPVSDAVDHPCPLSSVAVDRPCPVTSNPPAYSPVPSSAPPAYEFERRSTLRSSNKQRWKEDLQRSPIQV